jgi:ABC-type lipoprotein release transport system permease subunit
MLVQAFGGELGRSIPYFTALQLMALCVLIALVAAIVTAWRASGEKPLNVLRYE